MALEDHAVRACLAALGVQEEAKRLAVDVQDRDGLPVARSRSTTESLTLPEAQAAPVIRYMAVNVAADG